MFPLMKSQIQMQDKRSVFHRYFDGNLDKLFSECHVINPSKKSRTRVMNTRSSAQDMPCQICYLNYPNSVSAFHCFPPSAFRLLFGMPILDWITLFAGVSDRMHRQEKMSDLGSVFNVLWYMCLDHVNWGCLDHVNFTLLPHRYVQAGIIFLGLFKWCIKQQCGGADEPECPQGICES